ncbi:ABC transporter permease [Fimbriimonas ginsengisoli]|uniref:Macrolide export ATP-binding/permease protein MacB n=1 Tax=Fimbriimonas ginsengisoli Gsoil 348 TaxID=661478 RepID=A0A068NUW7_FIMGI|nr:ABC transporter permease [Fimbriimonas ginsengisoli]AIE85399.1 macrolide export ATP-binding/permease protein MacB [Fimbriimonas ginsengisoli Gsoil 348]
MNIGDSLRTALRAVAANKLRSFLTMLGVVIGVGSVIAMIGIGEGTKKKSLEQIQVMGTNMLTVFPNWRRGGVGMSNDVPTLKDEDVPALKKAVPLIEYITGSVGSRVMAKYKATNYMTQVSGGEPQMAIIRNATKMHAGHWYTMDDEASARRVCVLGWVTYQELFGEDNAVGATVRIKNQNFEVLGVVSYKGGAGNWNPDDQIYIPLSTAKHRLLGRTNLDNILIQGKDADLLPITQTMVEDTLGQKRRNTTGDPLFRVMNQGEWIETMQKQTQLLSILLAGIASISLLVGGIGIMNIMLVSVTERTREIGLRKAIGAKRESILWQFLLESVVMCTVGGLIGVLLGTATVFLISGLLKVPPVLNSQAILMAFGFSAGVGLFFGLYPAMRASRLQPIEALRYE